ncbi:ABC transporter permease [Burkholderia sp. SG-MS1]|uniref:ABC transporter permease n=1 Tax=Paraburkholderia sp. SG-MS1 TaxID=2023741 RepID=UPI00144612A3|nr:ABC transporter permease [Paraburkholderia sp. SG-MS1]NKJ48505.1 ABC transporter permease [Paraburkholderia sp. SG-MS1]
MKFARLLACLIAAVLVAPLFVVVPMSFSSTASLEFPPPGWSAAGYARFLASPDWMGALWHSILIASCATLIALALAIPASFALVRHTFFGRGAFNLLLMMPMIVPQIVMALGYYAYFGRLRMSQSFAALIIAHTCLALPVATLILTAAIRTFDRNLERAAMNLGARPMQTFWLVTFPVLRPAMLVAALFSFIQSFDEAVIAVFLAGPDTGTLPRQMFNSFRMEADPVISAASSFLLAIVCAAILAPLAVRIVRGRAAEVPARANAART